MDILSTRTVNEYRDVMTRLTNMVYPNMGVSEIEHLLDYSITKRFENHPAKVSNSYTKKVKQTTLLDVTEYIKSREPIVTAFGTMFTKHGEVPNPMAKTIQAFLDNRGIHKKMMFQFPKGSEDFEKYNLLQLLDKIDANGIYGVLAQLTSLLYNINVAGSITSQGRALVTSAQILFEMFLADNVQFGSVDEVLVFIDNVRGEHYKWKYKDEDVLDDVNKVDRADVFTKLVKNCGYFWIPDDEDLDIIWRAIGTLSQSELNRVYYKNNLYEFMENSRVFRRVEWMLETLDIPLYSSFEIPENIENELQEFCNLLMEYVYYRYQIIDRMDKAIGMVKSTIMISDTDSAIISLDAWYRYVVNKVNGKAFKIANYTSNSIKDKPEKITEPARVLDYNFHTDEIEVKDHINHPEIETPNDNMRYSIINILGYVLDRIINDYMEKLCENNHSIHRESDGTWNRPCKIFMKNEFLFRRVMMTQVKKNYASFVDVQEGNLIPEDEKMKITGIEIFVKSTKSEETREAMKKILLEDILNTPVIDQLKVIKDLAIFEKQLIKSLEAGERKYLKPAKIKSAASYDNPMGQQGIKGAVAWNIIKPDNLPAIDLDERNAIHIMKVNINPSNVDDIREEFPDVYENMIECLNTEGFFKWNKEKTKKIGNEIRAVSVPLNIEIPKWLIYFIDYTAITTDNISGFPIESIGIHRMGNKNINYTNIISI